MQLSEIRTQTRFYTRTNTTTFSDTDLDREANNAYDALILDIIRAQGYVNLLGNETETDLISTDGLSAGDNGFNGEYAFPTNFLRPTRFELLYTASGTPYKATIYDMPENSSSEYNEDTINSTFKQTEPFVMFFRNGYRTRPVNDSTTVVGGIHIWYEKRHDALSNDTDAPVFEASLHNLIPLKVAMMYALKYPEKYNSLWNREYNSMMKKLRAFYRHRLKIGKQAIPQRFNFN